MNSLKLLSVGDILLQTRNDRHPFERVAPLLADKDVLLGNLEVALTGSALAAEKSVPLVGHPEHVKYLREAGFDILSVANNHILDAGVEGFNDTLATLADNGIRIIGGANRKFPQSDCTLDSNGIRLGFLAYYIHGRTVESSGIVINRLEERAAVADIRRLKQQCHHVVLSLHWGTEKSFYPSPSQIDLAHRLVDSGASIILGHHPHVIQGIEEYKGALIAYSLGNFQFLLNPADLPPHKDRRTNRSIILQISLSENTVDSYETIPVIIDDDFVPRECSSEEGEEMLSFIAGVSTLVVDGRVKSLPWYGYIAEIYLSENWRSFMIRIKRYGVWHLCKFIVWLITPFVLKCYAGWLWRKLSGQRSALEPS
ncbi:MAG: CapA family protein [Candidatus Zixiibacteriota bacterium]